MQHTLPCSAITKKHNGYVTGTPVFFCKCQTCSGAYLCTYYTMTTKKTNINTKKVHTSTFTLAASGGFAIKLSHTRIRSYPFCDCKRMATIGSYKFIFGISGSHTPCGYGFLPYVEVAKAPDFLHAVELASLFFKLA